MKICCWYCQRDRKDQNTGEMTSLRILDDIATLVAEAAAGVGPNPRSSREPQGTDA